jgi:hypothetical protein
MDILLYTAVLIASCGSGSSTYSKIGTGYYVDSAVSGVSYVCGSQTGTTNRDGKFTFEKGKECSFEVAGIPLRTVSFDSLADGIKIVEDDVNVARLLQSIDNDGNPSNGIQITEEVAQVLQEAMNGYDDPTRILTDTSVLESTVAKIASDVTTFDGHVKTDAEVKAHIITTQTDATKELLAGKTFYAVENGDDEDNEGNGWSQFEINFNDDVTQLIVSDDSSNITITANHMTFNDNPDDRGYTIVTPMADYILFDDRDEGGRKEGSGHFLFSSKAKAQAFLDVKVSWSLSDNKFTTAYLNGKTFYFAQYDDFGYDGEGEPGLRWNMAKMVFTTNSSTWQEYNTPGAEVNTFINYTITDDGKISYEYNDDSSDTGFISATSVENDYIRVCEDDDCNTYMFFDEAKAQAFVNSQNSASANLASLVVGKTLYSHCKYDDMDDVEEITFSNDKTTLKELDGETKEVTSKIDGNVLTTYEDEDEDGEEEKYTHFLIESTDKYITFDDSNGGSSTFYYSKEDALKVSAEDCDDGDDEKLVSNLLSGHVTFKDENNNAIAIPSDAWVRIVPKIDGSWKPVNCKVSANFGDECYIHGSESDINEMKDIFQQDTTTYEVIVYKNHIEPSEHHWTCGEDAYKIIGNEVSSSSWENIMVSPEDYQDRSGDNCD